MFNSLHARKKVMEKHTWLVAPVSRMKYLGLRLMEKVHIIHVFSLDWGWCGSHYEKSVVMIVEVMPIDLYAYLGWKANKLEYFSLRCSSLISEL